MLVQTQKMSAAFSIKWTDNTTMEFYNLKNQKAVLLQKFVPPTNHKSYKNGDDNTGNDESNGTDHNKLMAAKAMKKIMITTT